MTKEDKKLIFTAGVILACSAFNTIWLANYIKNLKEG